MPRIRIEEKHVYSHVSTNVLGNIRNDQVLTPVGVFRWHEPEYPDQGTGQDQRIGRKIQSTKIAVEGYLQLENTITSDLPGAGNPSIEYYENTFMYDYMNIASPENYEYDVKLNNYAIPIRHMVVEFKDSRFYRGTDADKGNYLVAWFKNLLTQSTGAANHLPSVQQDYKRESTPYTGMFTILKDTTFWLNRSEKQQVHFKYELPYRRTINFEADGSDPTNSHIFFIWIGPVNPIFDYRNRAFGMYLNNQFGTALDVNVSPTVAYIDGTFKLKYVDL